MSRFDSRPLRAPLLVCAISSIGLLSGLVGNGQEVERRGEVKRPTRAFLTPDACASCHSNSGATPRFGGAALPALVRLDEFQTWEKQDKHRRAYDALEGPRGRRIQAKLGWKDVTRERACLSCHSTGFLPEDPPAETSGAIEARSQGVGCTACHGSYLEWIQNHGLAGEPIRKWRNTPPTDKSRLYGLTNLRDAQTKAEVCTSCHVGNAREGKVVTHAMYAAGHPPLSSFETTKFAEAMPPHWWKVDEVPLFQADPVAKARFVSPSNATRDAVIGDLTAYRASMKLLADHASGPNWPEYSAFECYACHHELESPGYLKGRQRRGFDQTFSNVSLAGRPGRPRLRAWPWAVSNLTLDQAGDLSAGMKNLLGAVDAVPFGDPDEVASAAGEVVTALDLRLKSAGAEPLAKFDRVNMLRSLTKLPDQAYPDFDSARQIGWMIGSVHEEPLDPNAKRVLADLNRYLKLDPYTSRDQARGISQDVKLSAEAKTAALLAASEEEYKATLAAGAGYDPEVFKALLKQLAGFLPGSLPPAIPEAR